jgi:arsenate reductase (thioredoxin)
MTQPPSPLDVLFLCRDDAVLGPMAEAMLNHWGRGRFRAWSAGWEPASGVHALTASALWRAGITNPLPRPRGWRQLESPDAPAFRVVVVLGDEDPASPLPALKGTPLVARWRIATPTSSAGDRVFERALREIEARVKLLASLRWDEARGAEIERRLAAIDGEAAASPPEDA